MLRALEGPFLVSVLSASPRDLWPCPDAAHCLGEVGDRVQYLELNWDPVLMELSLVTFSLLMPKLLLRLPVLLWSTRDAMDRPDNGGAGFLVH